MKSYRFLFLFCVALIGNAVFAQSQRELGQLMRERGEYYFTLTIDDSSESQILSEICSIDGVKGNTVVCYANQQEYDKLLQLGYRPDLQTPPSLREEAKMWEGGDRATYEWNSYLTYEQYVSMMEGFPSAVTNGANCTLIDLGTLSTNNHRRILGVRLNNGQPDGKPKFLYSSTMHGDEVTGMILMLRLIDEFCTSTDSRITNILDNVDLFIFPNTNPDGTYKGGNNTVTGAQRYNGNNIDLNRHFPDFDDGAHPETTSTYYYYQDEAQWMMELAQEYLFTMGANYHGGAEVMNYPWDTYQPLHVDDAWWQYISLEYVRLARQVHSTYMSDTESNGITNGYAWYTITGSRQDYMNYYGQCREITVECSSTKTPNASQLPNFWNYNHNSMLAFIEQCLNGIHGVVKDAVTNQPIVGATITVQNHDALGSSVTSHAVGDFHRPIKGGTWTLVVSKSGYQPQTVSVTVADDHRVDIEVHLTPRDANEMVCYEQVMPSAEGSYMMGSLNGNFLGMPTHNNSSKTITTLLDVTVKNYGFSVEETALPNLYSLIANGGQYYIKYKNYYLTRSNNKVTWSTSQSTSNKWYVNDNGIYQTSGSTNYYLVYNNGAFSISTINRNNITFYSERSCLPEECTVTATANPAEGGTIEGAGTYLEGETCTLTATANVDYQFIKWTENGTTVSTDATYSFEVTRNRALVAVFGSTIPMSVTLSANPARAGSVSGGGEYLYGQTCAVTAIANTGWTFTNWTENGTEVSTEQTYSFEVEEGRTLVANFSYEATVSGNCYYTANPVSAGDYVMGYLNGTMLKMLTRSNNGVAATTATVTVTDYGFSVEEGTDLSHITLAATGEQFFIKYGSYYLRKANNSTTLSWATSNSTPTSSNYKWYINANGIYLTESSVWSSTTYYLYYDTNSNSFKLSDNQNNNITFYAEGDCPVVPSYAITATANPTDGGTIEGTDLYYEGETCTLTVTANEGYTFVNWTENGEEVSTDAAYSFEIIGERALVANFEVSTVQQIVSLVAGWNWWTPAVESATLLSDLETALGDNGVSITSSEGLFVLNDAVFGWAGDAFQLEPGKMYMVQTNAACTLTLTGQAPVASDHAVTLIHGYNWIGYVGSASMSLTTALSGLEPEVGDVIMDKENFAIYDAVFGWTGDLNVLEPGKGYMYESKATETKIFYYPSGN